MRRSYGGQSSTAKLGFSLDLRGVKPGNYLLLTELEVNTISILSLGVGVRHTSSVSHAMLA